MHRSESCRICAKSDDDLNCQFFVRIDWHRRRVCERKLLSVSVAGFRVWLSDYKQRRTKKSWRRLIRRDRKQRYRTNDS